MLRRYRRFWCCIMGALLFAPLVIGIIAPDGEETFKEELRQPESVPEFPKTLAELRGIPAKLDYYLPDHFGLRGLMIHADAIVKHLWLASGNTLVQVARDGRLFYRSDHAQEQSAGVILRDARVAETAEVISQVHAALAARGVKFFFASPPNSATIYQDFLPQWAQRGGRRTEYGLLMEAMDARSVPAIDLRPVLSAARAQEPIYLEHDTHWTDRGALIAFNALVDAARHPDWRLRPEEALGPRKKIPGGDLARTLGLSKDVSEIAEKIALADPAQEILEPTAQPTFQASNGHDRAPAIMVIGDSFTTFNFYKLGLANARRFFWTHHRQCAVDWKWIEQFNPDEVWWMPTERYILCDPGVRPKGMPAIETFKR